MAEFRTDYKDQLLDSSVNTKRKYDLVDESGNVVAQNVSFEDKTAYSQNGDTFGAAEVNKIHKELNGLNDSLEDKTTWKYIGETNSIGGTLSIPNDCKELFICASANSNIYYGQSQTVPYIDLSNIMLWNNSNHLRFSVNVNNKLVKLEDTYDTTVPCYLIAYYR